MEWVSVVSGVAAGATATATLGRWIWRRLVNSVADALERLRADVSRQSVPPEIIAEIQRTLAAIEEQLERLSSPRSK